MFIQSKFKPFNIKVIGVGGVGSKTVQEMEATRKFPDIEFIALQPESDNFLESNPIAAIQLSPQSETSYEGERSFEKWRAIALANKETIKQVMLGADIVFISCNEGKGFGTGVSPVVADIAHECGALVIAIVTEPFTIEGNQRMEVAKEGIALLKQSADTVIPVYKQRIFENILKDTLFTKVYSQVKVPLYQSVRIISDIIRLTKLINIDLADLKLIMENAGNGFIGEGEGSGKSCERIQKALDEAFSFPLTNNSIAEAKNLMLHITGGTDLSMEEVDRLCSIVSKSVYSQANMKYGVTIDEKMNGKIKVSIIATSLNDRTPSCKNPCSENGLHSMNHLSDLDIPSFVRNN